jgi:chromosome partitioning protein
MIVTVASFKGGVGKTTSAVHLAAFLQRSNPTLLIDGDPNRSASGWARRGQLPFEVVDERQMAKAAQRYAKGDIVIDTEARPEEEDLKTLAGGCDILIVPTTPDALSLDALRQTVKALQTLGNERFRVLITMVPPRPSRDGDDARAMLVDAGLPLFTGSIRRLVAFQKAALAGIIVGEVSDPRAKEAWLDYQRVGEEVLSDR